jgi:heme/copper-type cytochrome/quinol oxidase subunit 4
MCFSYGISFTVSIALAVIGTAAIKRTSRKSELLFAAIPLLFSLQQLVEGVIWLQLLKSGDTYWLAQAYTLFVGMLWPVMAPLSIWLLEPKRINRCMMLPVLATGIGIALYTAYALWQFPVTTRIAEYCISYEYPVPQPHLMLVAYIIATCAAFFIASDSFIVWLGGINLAAFAASYYIYSYDLTSVWCFFAAIISGMIYLYFDQHGRREAKLHLTAY